ncbi:MAG: hypothetical protein HY781_03625 [Chloroflexi bacterium]|nr:hypothetical protein [Chloroflexota bacterium]
MSRPTVKSSSVAFIFLAHLSSREIFQEYKKIRASIKGLGIPWFLFQGDKNGLPKYRKFENLFIVDQEKLFSTGLPLHASRVVPGSSHFPLLQFYKTNPEYTDYWLVEYDVRFSGNWRLFFSELANIKADLIAAHIFHNKDEPDWPFWELTHPIHSIPLENRLRCFHPIYRISNAALSFIFSAQQDGWRGHSEVLLPTLLYQQGFSIADIGGTGEFVAPGLHNRFYTSSPPNRKGRLDSGTLRHRPVYTKPGRERNKLYHPVKPYPKKGKERLRAFLVFVFGKPLASQIIAFAKSFLEKT